jgi:polyisoprenyl-teichoic acid--peptidoglycan teichoic acid transferase
VEYYAQVDFNGFIHLIDLIGGIDVDVPKTIHDEQYPTHDYGIEVFHLDAGRRHLDGATALKYVRTRFTDNDYKRASRQQQVIQAALDKILQADMIPTLIARAPEILATLRESIHTDVPVTLAIDLAEAVRQHPLDRSQQLVLNDAFGEETYSDEGAWILIPDRSRIRPALAQFFASMQEGGRFEPPLATAHMGEAPGRVEPEQHSASAIAPDSVRLEILNGTGYPGVAARTRDLLTSRGWQVVSIGDADRSDYRRTLLVDYGTADTLIDRINADLALSSRVSTLTGLNHPEAIDLRIIIGQDFLKNVLGTMN